MPYHGFIDSNVCIVRRHISMQLNTCTWNDAVDIEWLYFTSGL